MAIAKFYFAPGGVLGLGEYSSEKDDDGDALVDLNAGGGLHLDSEMELFLNFSANLGLQYFAMNSTIQYNYTNPDNASDTGSVKNLNTGMTLFGIMPSLRFYLLDGKSIKFYIGAGTYSASLSLSPSEEEYEEETNTSNGYLESTSTSVSGSMQEIGLKYFWDDKNGLQFAYKKISFKSDDVEILDDQSFSSEIQQFMILYNHTVDWSFFWR